MAPSVTAGEPRAPASAHREVERRDVEAVSAASPRLGNISSHNGSVKPARPIGFDHVTRKSRVGGRRPVQVFFELRRRWRYQRGTRAARAHSSRQFQQQRREMSRNRSRISNVARLFRLRARLRNIQARMLPRWKPASKPITLALALNVDASIRGKYVIIKCLIICGASSYLALDSALENTGGIRVLRSAATST